jgi:hypothetical protein
MSVAAIQPDDTVRLTQASGDDTPDGYLEGHDIGDAGEVVTAREGEACVDFDGGGPTDIWWVPLDWLDRVDAERGGA